MFALLEDAPCAPFSTNIDHFQRYFGGSFEKCIEIIRSISKTVLCESITSHLRCQPIYDTHDEIAKIIASIPISFNRSTSFVKRRERLEALRDNVFSAANPSGAPKCPITPFDNAATSPTHATTIKKQKYARTANNAHSWPCLMPYRHHASQVTHCRHIRWSCACTRTESLSLACTQRACRHDPFSWEMALRGWCTLPDPTRAKLLRLRHFFPHYQAYIT